MSSSEGSVNSDILYLLILGSPRSGTTLLSAMISCHPDIAVLYEDTYGAVFNILSKKIKGVKLCIPNQIEIEHTYIMRINDLFFFNFYKYLNYMRLIFGRAWKPIPRTKKSSLSIRDYEKKAKKLHILGIIRNPNSVVESIMKRGGQPKQLAEYRWRRAIEILYQLSKERLDNEFLTIVNYDKLVTEPKFTMQKIFLRIGSDFNEVVLEGYKYTIDYNGRTRIESEKALDNIEFALNHPLLQENKELKEKYLYLLEKSI